MANRHDIIRLRRGTASEWSASLPQPDGEVLRLGEPGYEKDTRRLKIGDGITPWNSLPYFNGGTPIDPEQIEDLIGNSGFMVAGTGINIYYNDIAVTLTISASGLNSNFISDFDQAVQDNLDTSLIAGTGINLYYDIVSSTLAISASGLINNPTNNRILTSRDTTTTGIDAESNLTFDGTTLTVIGDIISNYIYSELDGTVIVPCKNNTVSTINIGTPVYISGHFANGKVYVEPADASNSAKMPAVGLLGSTLTSGSEGHVHVFGSLKLDTTGLGYTDPTDVGKTLYVASGGGLTLTRPTGETDLVQNIARLARIHNNGKYIILGPGRSNDVPNSITAYKLDIDNIRIDGNTLSSTDTNGNIVLSANGSGDVQIDADTLRVGDANATATITSNGTGNLVLNTNGGTNSGSVTIAQGTNGNITIEPNGSGDVHVNADTLRIGDSNSNATLTTNGTGDLILNTNSGTNSGSITIQDGANNNIIVSPNGNGQIILGKESSSSDPQELSYANGRFSSDGDARFSSYIVRNSTSSSGWNSLYLNYNTNTDDTITIDSTTATFVINISGRGSNGDSAGFIIRGCVKKFSSTVSLVGSPIIESFLDSNFATANAQISTSGSGLIIQVDQGSSGVSGIVYWVASVQMSRVIN